MRKILLILALCLTCEPCYAAWTFKNSGTGNSGASNASSQNATAFSAALTNGSVIVVFAQQNNGAAVTFTVSDTAGNSFADCGKGQLSWFSGNEEAQCFLAINSHTTASDVVNLSSSASAPYLQIAALEYTGNAASSVVDNYAGQATTSGSGSSNITSGSASTLTDGDLIVGASNNIYGGVTAGTGFVSRTSNGFVTEDKTQTTHGSVAATFTDDYGSGDPYVCFMVAIKPSSGAAAKACTLTTTGAGSC